MSNKWIRLAFIGAIGAGMVANFAYQSVVMGQVEDTVQEGDAQSTETVPQERELKAKDVIVERGVQVNRSGQTIEVNGGRSTVVTTVPATVFPGTASLPGLPTDVASVYRFSQVQDSELNASELAVAKLLKELQGADESDKTDIVDQIKAEVAKQFELRQEARAKELKELEEQLVKLKQKHEKRESMKDKIIEDRVSQLVDNLEGLGWGTEPVPFGGSGFPGVGFGTANRWLTPTAETFGPAAVLPAVPPAPPVGAAAPSSPARRIETRERKGDNGGR